MRKLKYRYQRDEVCQRLIADFARGQSFWHRMLFVDACQHLLDTFSRIFFKSNFFFIVLELAKDRVANVRMKLCEMLPLLKRTLKLPKDNTALERLVHYSPSSFAALVTITASDRLTDGANG
jgi:serine/threonine-protein phosphatase 4 regulatory subunit 4